MVLASASPRRRELLALAGWEYSITPAAVDESPYLDEDPQEYVLRIASDKALAISAEVEEDVVVIAADTTVVDAGEILGKPADAVEAQAVLTRLRGRMHQVYTALAVKWRGELHTELAVTDVPMREYSDTEIDAYIQTGDPFDKAGAYAIQHSGFHPVENMQACYANVVGLPLCHLTRLFHKIGVQPATDIPVACQAHLAYDCPVHQKVLKGKL
ncbi:MAG: septum formation protein Maf [Chloroflexi bacterium]|nr:MAG: septum formation protein Maf [Chloroflexota bacterium]MBL1197084.1 septum formation protein Maf [Chloroflexota bacterium]NOH14379.1 septum formation protein Maf [Chloroflexota bacterium]